MPLTTYYPNGQRHIVEERVNGKRNGEVLIYNANGQEISIMEYDNLQVRHISYKQNSLQHNEHGPACMFWYGDGQIYYIEYWQNDLKHNEHYPDYMHWYSNGQFYRIEYHQNGYYHNLHGPAYMQWYRNSQIYRFNFCHFGKLIERFEF